MNALRRPPVEPPRRPAAGSALPRPSSPEPAGLLLLDSLPQSLVTALGELPRRLLFTNENVSLLLVGLRRGQTLANFRPPVAIRLTVVLGHAALREDGDSLELTEGQQWVLQPTARYDVQALDCLDLVFLVPAYPPAADGAHIASTPSRNVPLAAASR